MIRDHLDYTAFYTSLTDAISACVPAALDELVKRQGWTSAAARVTGDPLQLGELRSKEVRAKREAAQCAAGAIGPSLKRIGEPRHEPSGATARA